jgi:hypothetical protein
MGGGNILTEELAMMVKRWIPLMVQSIGGMITKL